ncbi:DMT family transporter [Pseudaestuariivita atlantica]|uniref:Membrane protein n=1 Tax=Pseudaestuariivita atlantica TaxID=1317121 RepID=A0A0L1JP71_9RHOB|nr:DMT family transporter [Pseudaestuariivita atlantica]KNG93559.1 membrane protein [Pseudaestuariivita atlantica]
MSPLRGIALKLTAVFLFMIMASLIKATADVVPPGEAVFFRSFFAIPVILVWLVLQGEVATGLRVKSRWGHFWRGASGAAAMVLSFASLGMLPLPEVTAIGYAAPLITVALAAWLLGERVRLFRWSMVLVGLVGVLIVLSPRLSIGSDVERLAAIGAALALASAALRSLAQVYIRKLVQFETTSSIVFYFSLTCTLLSLVTLPWGWVMPGPADAAMLIGAGIVGGIAQIFLTTAYRHAPASLIAPFDYASMLFALIIGYVVFEEVPTAVMLAGSTVVIGAGVAIIWRERALGLKRGTARSLKSPHG